MLFKIFIMSSFGDIPLLNGLECKCYTGKFTKYMKLRSYLDADICFRHCKWKMRTKYMMKNLLIVFMINTILIKFRYIFRSFSFLQSTIMKKLFKTRFYRVCRNCVFVIFSSSRAQQRNFIMMDNPQMFDLK